MFTTEPDSGYECIITDIINNLDDNKELTPRNLEVVHLGWLLILAGPFDYNEITVSETKLIKLKLFFNRESSLFYPTRDSLTLTNILSDILRVKYNVNL